MSAGRIIRVLLATSSSGGGNADISNTIAREMRESGMEVIYSGSKQTPEQIVGTAIQEDVDVISIIILQSRGQTARLPQVMDLLSEDDVEGMLVIAVGTFTHEDRSELAKIGVKGVDPTEVVGFIIDEITIDRDR